MLTDDTHVNEWLQLIGIHAALDVAADHGYPTRSIWDPPLGSAQDSVTDTRSETLIP
jgi:hypothetical protein